MCDRQYQRDSGESMGAIEGVVWSVLIMIISACVVALIMRAMRRLAAGA